VVRLSALRTGRLTPRKYSWYSFLLEAESTPGPECGRKDYVNEKFIKKYFGKVCALELPGFVSVHAAADVTAAQI